MAAAQLHDRIQWHEGMLLTPQHFQQESARVDALVAWQALAAQPQAWGVRRLVLDEPRLAGGVLRVNLLEAILPNGVAVRHDGSTSQGATLELDLAGHADAMAQGPVPVYLVLGTARSLRLPGQPSMFRPVASALVEDEVSESLAEEVPRMAANLMLAAGPAPGAAWVSMQLLTLTKENEIVQRGPYWPAQLEIDTGSNIARRAGALAALLRAKAVFLARQSGTNVARLEDRVANLEQRMHLAHVALHLPLLEATLDMPAIPPLALYLALCAQLGALASLRPGAVPLVPPRYVHEDSYAAFVTLLDHLESLAGEVSQEWRSCTFNFDGDVFALPLHAELLGARLVVGLRGASERDVAQWMAGATIGSRTVSASLRDRRMPGAARRPIDAAPELGLRASAGCFLFEVTSDEHFIVAGQDLLIGNDNGNGNGPSGRAGVRPDDIVLFIKG